MQFLDLTLPTAAENLALDEALLEELNANSAAGIDNGEALRIWEPAQCMVVIGRSSRIADEVDLDFASANDIPVMRRTSGGAAIVTGPGCLMYAVTLDLNKRPQLREVDVAHCFVLKHLRDAVNACGASSEIKGTSDLAIDNRKFSGNSLRLKKDALLYHGTILNRFDLSMVSRCLKTPPRQPEYRENRSHSDFVMNLHLDEVPLKRELRKVWNASASAASWPDDLTSKLAREKYDTHAWNHRH